MSQDIGYPAVAGQMIRWSEIVSVSIGAPQFHIIKNISKKFSLFRI
jgi:hypothetical protein